MLSDSERQTLHEMQRQLSAEDPDFVRRFDVPDPHRPVPRRRVRFGVFLAKLVAALAIMDPQPLTDSQIAAVSVIPSPRRRTL